MRLVFSGPDRTADDLIRSRIEAAHSRKGVCVVSSDNGVYGYARSCGVDALKCHEFNRLIRQESAQAAEQENRDVAPEDLQRWMRYFGEEDEG